MYNYSALWIRLVWLVIIGLIAVIIILLFGKSFKIRERIVALVLAIALIILGGSSTFKAIINPKVETIVGYYEGESKQKSLNPFEMNYIFICDDEKFFLELDPFSKKKIFNQDFEKGKEYTVYYEENTNLIVAISQND